MPTQQSSPLYTLYFPRRLEIKFMFSTNGKVYNDILINQVNFGVESERNLTGMEWRSR